jgi:hypothetical protein
MPSSVRWSPEQLAEYQKRRNPEVRSRVGQIVASAERKRSQAELRFEQQLIASRIEFIKEYYHIQGRGLRLDFAILPLDMRIGVEIQGAVHHIKGKFAADIEKRALGMLAGWRILEVDSAAVKDGRGIEWLRQLLEGRT